MKKEGTFKLFRFVIQIIFLLILPGLFINTFTGIKLIYTSIINGNFNFVENLSQIVEVIVIIPITIVLGRFFCGFICAFGTFSDLIYEFSKKVLKTKYRVENKTDKLLKMIKYVLFGLIILLIWSFSFNKLSDFDPWNVFGMIVNFKDIPNFTYIFSEFFVASIILILIVIGSLYIERFFCRYLCPLGAIFSIISFLRIVKINKPRENCGKCMACTKNCKMGIALNESDRVNSNECINCYECSLVCPKNNITNSISEKIISKGATTAVAITAITGLYYVGTIATKDNNIFINETSQDSLSKETNNLKNQYQDGSYEGTGTGFRGEETRISITIKSNIISSIKVISFGDDAPYFDRAYNKISSDIIKSQSTNVDVVSGATYSSLGITNAVNNALEKAKINVDNNKELSTPKNYISSKTENIKNESKIEEKIKDGKYEGSASGFRRGITKVSVQVKEGKISDITILSHGDDAPFFNRVLEPIVTNIIKKQSTKVDVISGATYSSKGIMNAVANALNKAK